MHINEIYSTNELEEKSTSKKFLLVQNEGNREVKRNVQYYNLDMVISVGYRVKQDKLYKSDFDLLMEEAENKDNN